MLAPRALLMPGSPRTAAQRRRLRLILAGASALAAALLLVTLEAMQRTAGTAAANPASLGLPADTALAAAGGREHFWTRWDRQLKKQEQWVGQWRERQRRVVYEETAAEEAMVVAKVAAGTAAEAAGGAQVAAQDSAAARRAAAALLSADKSARVASLTAEHGQ